MSGTIEELLGVIAGVDEEDDLLVKIREAACHETSLEMRLEILVLDGTDLGTWSIRCEHLLAHTLRAQTEFSLELVDDHPLL